MTIYQLLLLLVNVVRPLFGAGASKYHCDDSTSHRYYWRAVGNLLFCGPFPQKFVVVVRELTVAGVG